MYLLHVEDEFASAHQLREYKGKCEQLHGHNWKVRLTVCGEQLDAIGMLIDFAELKKMLKELTGRFDHKLINEIPPFDKSNPTSENLAAFLAEGMAALLPDAIKVKEVTVWESNRCSATYLE